MTLLSLSIIFSKGNNIQNQLRFICSCSCKGIKQVNSIVNVHNREDEFDSLLEMIDNIYNLGNSETNIMQLQSYLLRYADKITSEYNRCNELMEQQALREANVYELKK